MLGTGQEVQRIADKGSVHNFTLSIGPRRQLAECSSTPPPPNLIFCATCYQSFLLLSFSTAHTTQHGPQRTQIEFLIVVGSQDVFRRAVQQGQGSAMFNFHSLRTLFLHNASTGQLTELMQCLQLLSTDSHKLDYHMSVALQKLLLKPNGIPFKPTCISLASSSIFCFRLVWPFNPCLPLLGCGER